MITLDLFTNNKACSKNIFFIVTAVVYSAVLFYNSPSQPPYFCTANKSILYSCIISIRFCSVPLLHRDSTFQISTC
jgi:hypothetical protein